MIRDAMAQQWRERFDDFAESDRSVREWCDFNRLSTHQYYYWRRRLAAANDNSQPIRERNAAHKPRFLAVEVAEATPPPATSGGVLLRIAGATIEVAPGFDTGMLRAVVAALATQPC